MSDTTVMRRMFNSQVLINLEDSPYAKSKKNVRKQVLLQESKSPGSKVTITDIPADAIVLDVDKALSNKLLFSGNESECKRADFIIISESEEKVIFIEMKAGRPHDHKAIVAQLKGALCVFEYCQIIAREFYQEAAFLRHYQKRFYAFTHTDKSKQTTVPGAMPGSGQNTSPEKRIVISGRSQVGYQKLAA